MSTNLPKTKYLSVREAAWLLGVPRSSVSRAIRVGVIRVVRRRGGLAVPASEVVKLLGGVG